jgi:hypothetical protein
MMTIVTNSNRKVPENIPLKKEENELLKFQDLSLDEVWQQDQKIESKIFAEISKFTTITLDRNTFV